MRKVLSMLLLLTTIAGMLFCQTAEAPSNYGESDAGTSANPYKISSLNNLYWIAVNVNGNTADFYNKYFEQTSDIDASATVGWFNSVEGGECGWIPIGQRTTYPYYIFKGSYNGNGHVISGLNIKRVSTDYVGLFAVAQDGTISNLGLTDVNISGKNYVGGLVGFVTSTSLVISNCNVTGIINYYNSGSNNAGGLIGYSQGTVTNCHNEADVKGNQYVGGISGYSKGAISRCRNSGIVDGANTAGGITGYISTSKISNCYNTGDIICTTGNTSIGGIAGESVQTIEYCYNIGNINNGTGTNIGAIAGKFVFGCTFTGDIWNTETSKATAACGSTPLGGATGKTTAEMKTASAYISAGWDINIWKIDAALNNGYPFLAWENEGGTALPVELTSFRAKVKTSGITLEWTTATEMNNYGFEIERSILSSEFRVLSYEKIGFVGGAGNSSSAKSYSFTDNTVPAGKYSYRLKQTDNDGKYKYSASVEVSADVLPSEFVLSQNYPNPFNPSTVISYQLPEAAYVTLRVYDMLGREVVTLADNNQEAGKYSAVLDAGRLSSGTYIACLRAGSYIKNIKMDLIK